MIVERSTPRVFSEAPKDHQARYTLALDYVQPGARILDAACGVGYGAHYLANNSPCELVVAVDIADEALQWAGQHFVAERLTYVQADLSGDFPAKLPFDQYDLITSFETLEHLQDDRSFQVRLKALLKPGGYLLLSVPNEDLVPWHLTNNQWHFRHYRSTEILDLMAEMGFYVVDRFSQTWAAPMFRGLGGEVNVVVCQSVPGPVFPQNDLHAIAAACNVLTSTRNEIAEVAGYTALKKRFNTMLEGYAQFSRALDLVSQRAYDQAIAMVAAIEPALCPERDFVLGLAFEGKHDLASAATHYRQLLSRRSELHEELARKAEERLAAVAPGVQLTVEFGDWDVVPPHRFLDQGGLAKLQRLLTYTDADVVLAPVLYELFPEHQVARWEPVAWRRGGGDEKLEQVRAYVRGESPDLWYADAYQAFRTENYETALSLFAGYYEETSDPLDRAVLIRWVALCMLELGRDEDAVELLTDALQMYPDYGDLRYLLFQVVRLSGETELLEEIIDPVMNAGDSANYPEFFYDIRGLLLRHRS